MEHTPLVKTWSGYRPPAPRQWLLRQSEENVEQFQMAFIVQQHPCDAPAGRATHRAAKSPRARFSAIRNKC